MGLTANYMKDEFETKKLMGSPIRILQEKERLASIGETLGGVAHEINNPLQIILGKTQILLMRISREKCFSKLVEDLKAIEKSAKRIAELIDCLNDLAPKKSKHKEINTDIDLNYLIGSIISLIRASLKDKKIELDTDISENLPKVKGNSTKIKELLLSLTLNAKHRLEPGGKLKITCKKDKGFLKIEFNDQGEGFSSELQRYLENPLSQDISSLSHFGILNSYQILKQHQGDLKITSTPDKQNTITMYLPTI